LVCHRASRPDNQRYSRPDSLQDSLPVNHRASRLDNQQYSRLDSLHLNLLVCHRPNRQDSQRYSRPVVLCCQHGRVVLSRRHQDQLHSRRIQQVFHHRQNLVLNRVALSRPHDHLVLFLVLIRLLSRLRCLQNNPPGNHFVLRPDNHQDIRPVSLRDSPSVDHRASRPDNQQYCRLDSLLVNLQ
jgi:hypothetical protein